MTPVAMFAALIAGHALADYPLQGPFLSEAKSPVHPIPGVPWWQAMGAHAVIHGGAVGLITGVWWLGLCEAALHFLIDTDKCRGRFTYNQDQGMHIACKVVWVLLAWSLHL